MKTIACPKTLGASGGTSLHTAGVTGSIPVAPTIDHFDFATVLAKSIQAIRQVIAERSGKTTQQSVENPWTLFTECS
jgi:hypothetical protein